MDSLFSSSTNLFFGRSTSAIDPPVPVTSETSIMPPAVERVSRPIQVAGPAQTGNATPTIVRLSADDEADNNIDDEAAAAASLVVSDILKEATKPKASAAAKVNGKTPTPTPGTKDDEKKDGEPEQTTASGRSARKRVLRIPPAAATATPSTKSRAHTPRAGTATKRKATDGAEIPASKRGRSAQSGRPASSAAKSTTADDKENVEKQVDNEDKAATKATPAKHGHQPRASMGAATPGKKTGRPGKAAGGKVAPKPASTFPSGARRGRPPGSKNATSSSSPVKTRPLTGRQAALKAHKIATAPPPPKRSAATGAASATGKKRGRKPSATTKTAKTAASTTGKKRGRKPKEEAAEYVVEAIGADRVNPVTLVIEYNVKWAGYSASENTWEPRANLAGCEALLKAYEKEKK